MTSADEEAVAASSRWCRRLVPQPAVAFGESGFNDWLRELDRQHGFDLIIPATENSLLALQQLIDADELRRKAVLPPVESVEIALDKGRTLQVAAAAGIRIPRTQLHSFGQAALPEVGFPVALKPVRSQVFMDARPRFIAARIVRSAAEREAYLQRYLPLTDIQEQQYVQGIGYGVELLFQRGQLRWVFAHERLHELPLQGGGSTYRRAVEPVPELVAQCAAMAGSLAWHGLCMYEFKRGADGAFILMEINPRLWGSVPLAIGAGVPFPWGLWLIATGQDAGAQPAFRAGLRARRLIADLEWMYANQRADHSDPLLLTRPRGLSLLEWGLPLLGKERWDHFSWSDPGPAKAECRALGGKFLRASRRMADALICAVRARMLKRKALAFLSGREPGLEGREVAHGGREPVRRVLFVCYGNICRSPFAQLAAQKSGIAQFEFESRGTRGGRGERAPAAVAAAAAALGFDLWSVPSKQLLPEDLERHDLILALDRRSHAGISSIPGMDARKVHFLGLFGPSPVIDIADPVDMEADAAERVLRQIMGCVDGLLRAVRAPSR